MGSLKLYNTDISRESIVAEREQAYLQRSPTQKLFALLSLNRISIQMNGGNPLKTPQGKGIIICKPKA
jgi:hypothetical protein